MTLWMLSGLSFAWRSYTLHGSVDWGLLLSAVSTYIYLVKFFIWEVGYLRSIDIIVDRAGWIQWGCLVFVPAVYSFHTRLLVLSPSGLPLEWALPIFLFGLSGVWLNFAADRQRQLFRESEGEMLIWGEEPVYMYITAKWQLVDSSTGKTWTKASLLLASGYWGAARHLHYLFELMVRKSSRPLNFWRQLLTMKTANASYYIYRGATFRTKSH
jgi:7-dehydrocholesterol reductase